MADEQKGLLDEIDQTFYGGGHAQAPPSPTPRPTPAPRRFSMMDRMNSALSQAFKYSRPTSMPQDPLTAAMNGGARFMTVPWNMNHQVQLMGTPQPSGFSYLPRFTAQQIAQPPNRLFYYQNPTQFEVVPNYRM